MLASKLLRLEVCNAIAEEIGNLRVASTYKHIYIQSLCVVAKQIAKMAAPLIIALLPEPQRS